MTKVIAKRFTVLETLGRGGFGVVYKVRDEQLKVTKALKLPHATFAEDDEFLGRFEREMRILLLLNHQNILPIRDTGITEEKLPFFTLDYCEGRTLRDVCDASEPFPIDRALNVIRQILDALDAAHRQNVLHRDLKPSNIMLVDVAGHEEVRVLDFGIGKIIQGGEEETAFIQMSMAMGTPAYMSPEQIESGPVDQRSDIYGAGLILYEMLAGERAFAGKSISETLDKIRHSVPKPLRDLRTDEVPRWLNNAIRCSLMKDPNERFQTCTEFRNALDSTMTLHLEAGSANPPKRAAVDYRRGSLRSRRQFHHFGALAGLLLLVSAIVWFARGSASLSASTFVVLAGRGEAAYQNDALGTLVECELTQSVPLRLVVSGTLHLTEKSTPRTIPPRTYLAANAMVRVPLHDLLADEGTYRFEFYVEPAIAGAPSAEQPQHATVILDRTPPRLLLDGDVLTADTVRHFTEERVRVTVDEPSLESIIAGGVSQEKDALGQLTLRLPDDGTSLEVEIRDLAGNQSRFRLRRDIQVPRIDWPPNLKANDSMVVLDGIISVTISVSDDGELTDVAFRLDGSPRQPRTATEHEYTLSLPLRYGANLLEVVAHDAAGRKVTEARTFERQHPPDPQTGVTATVRGESGPVYTSHPEFEVALFSYPDPFRVDVEVDVSNGATRRFSKSFTAEGRLAVRLADLGTNEGQYELTYSLKEQREQTELFRGRGTVILDRSAPRAYYFDGNGNKQDLGPPTARLITTNASLRVFIDESNSKSVHVNEIPIRLPETREIEIACASPASLVIDDLAGNRTSYQFDLLHDRAPPTIEVVGLENPTDQREIRLQLQLTDDTGVRQGEVRRGRSRWRLVAKENNIWETAIPLLVGQNSLRVEVEDLAGRNSALETRVTRRSPRSADRTTASPFPSHVEREKGTRYYVAQPLPEVRMVLVEAGRFPFRDQVTAVESFLLDKYEVTNAQYQRFLVSLSSSERDKQKPAYWGDVDFSSDIQPVVGVSLAMARAFASWAGKEIPNEIEWEYAAAWDGEKKRTYPWGDVFEAGGLRERATPPPVAANDLDLTYWGNRGMGGGVQEWCELVPPEDDWGAIRGWSQVTHGRQSQLDRSVFRSERAHAIQVKKKIVGFRCIVRPKRK